MNQAQIITAKVSDKEGTLFDIVARVEYTVEDKYKYVFEFDYIMLGRELFQGIEYINESVIDALEHLDDALVFKVRKPKRIAV